MNDHIVVGSAYFPIILFGENDKIVGSDIALLLITRRPWRNNVYVEKNGLFIEDQLFESAEQIHTALNAVGAPENSGLYISAEISNVPISGCSLGVATAVAYLKFPHIVRNRRLVWTGEVRKENDIRYEIYPIRYLDKKIEEVSRRGMFLVAPSSYDQPEPAKILSELANEKQVFTPDLLLKGIDWSSPYYICAVVNSLPECYLLVHFPML